MEAFKMKFFSFIKDEAFFKGVETWDKLGKVVDHETSEEKKRIALKFKNSDQGDCVMLINFIRDNTIRFRFNPIKSSPDQFAECNKRTIVRDTISELTEDMPTFSIHEEVSNESVSIISKNKDGNVVLKLVINFDPFCIKVYKVIDGQLHKVLEDANQPIYYRKVKFKAYGKEYENYSIIQAKKRTSPTASYYGFGEKAGHDFKKNGKRLTYFNFDNMRYHQIYGEDNADAEPLYHSNPFFLEFNANPNKKCIYGIFIDNASETLINLDDQNRYYFGSIFEDLDYYLFVGEDCEEVLGAFSSITGHARLKPRYVLGYHQGAFGYKNSEELLDVIDGYRKAKIPLDGLHIDVDIQHQYRTFTIDEENFPPVTKNRERIKPTEDVPSIFAIIEKDYGVKCSTNITPIISCEGETKYETYEDAIKNDKLLIDKRYFDYKENGRSYQQYDGDSGNDSRERWLKGDFSLYHRGKPYVGRVYYGKGFDSKNRTTSGCYPNLYDKETRIWWGKQYEHLYKLGLKMVWQDMTAPAIGYEVKNNNDDSENLYPRGDMRSFPFDLMVKSDFIKKYNEIQMKPLCEDPDCIGYPEVPAITVRNLYAYNLIKATYHGLNNLKSGNNERNFIIGRGGFSGIHRFAGMWTGDNASDWNSLRLNLPQVLAMGISGQPIAGADIGGFEPENDGKRWADPELIIRWVLMGSFLGWFRNHYNGGALDKDNNKKKEFQELYKFSDENLIGGIKDKNYHYMYHAVVPITRFFIRLRYRFMQLLYDQMFENTITGMPIARALMLNFPYDSKLFEPGQEWRLYTEYMVGKDLLIAPVLEKQDEGNKPDGKREIYLPESKGGTKWYAFKDNRFPLDNPIKGGDEQKNVDAKINSEDFMRDDRPHHIENNLLHLLPIYVREGAILPTIKEELYVGELKTNHITLNIYPGETGNYSMYLDDGITRESAVNNIELLGYTAPDPLAANKYRKVNVNHKYTTDKTREISITRAHNEYDPELGFFYIALLHDSNEAIHGSPVKTLKIDDEVVTEQNVTDDSQNEEMLKDIEGNCWYYNKSKAITFIKILDSGDLKVIVNYN